MVRFRAVFFDAGETLVHPSPSFHELFAEVLMDAGHDVAAETVRERSHVVSERFAKAARDGELWTTSEERSRAFWHSIYAAYLSALDLEPGEGLADTLYETFSDPSRYELFDDVMPAVRALARTGIEMGVISNFESWLDGFLSRSGAGEFLTVRAISGIEGVEKPDPRIFEIALERAGVAATQSAYVGDSPGFDVEPAREVGMLPVLLDRAGRHEDVGCARIGSLSELPAVVGL
jgi:putative hydrolase of the HAD superfamily